MRSIGSVGLARIYFLTVLAAFSLGWGVLANAQDMRASDLKEHTHIHGLAVDRNDPSQLLVATHHGLYRVMVDGNAKLISVVQDFMGFTPDPSDPNSLFASGHPARGANLGFITSRNNGETWQQVHPALAAQSMQSAEINLDRESGKKVPGQAAARSCSTRYTH
jgi:hypothetical protein